MKVRDDANALAKADGVAANSYNTVVAKLEQSTLLAAWLPSFLQLTESCKTRFA